MRLGEFTKLTAPMFLLFMGDKTSDALMRAYYTVLGDVEMEDLAEAVKHCMATCEFMPKPKAVLEAISGPAEDKAMLAWDEVRKAIRSHGRYASVDFADRAINAAIRSTGGWMRLCDLPQEEFDVWAKKDFSSAYTSHLRGGVAEDSGRYLPGLIELQEGVADVVKIGGGNGKAQVRIDSTHGRSNRQVGEGPGGRSAMEVIGRTVRAVSKLPAGTGQGCEEG